MLGRTVLHACGSVEDLVPVAEVVAGDAAGLPDFAEGGAGLTFGLAVGAQLVGLADAAALVLTVG